MLIKYWQTMGKTLKPAKMKTIQNLFWPCFLAVFFFYSFLPVWADSFKFVSPSSGPGLYTTSGANNSVTISVQAQSSPGVVDLSYAATVQVGLYDTATTQFSDPQAVYVTSTGATLTGPTVPLTFVGGNLNFGVTFAAGSNSEQVSIFDNTNNINGTYPGALGVTTGAAITVVGFSTSYYLYEVNNSTVPVVYDPLSIPVSFDSLIPNNPNANQLNPITGGFYGVTIINGAGVSNSLCFAVTGVNGGYAAAGAGIAPSLYFSKKNNTSAAPITYQVILDFTGTLTDFNNPRSQDMVWQGDDSGSVNTGPLYSKVTSLSYFSGPTTYASNITNGQIIVRAWTAAPATNPVSLIYEDVNGLVLSNVTIPYAPKNTQPLSGGIVSPAVALDSSVTTMQYAVTNLYSSPVSVFAISIPPNNPASGTPWGVSIISQIGSLPGSNLSVVEPTVSNPGTILFNGGVTNVPVGQSVTLNLGVTVSSQDNPAWPFPFLYAISNLGVTIPTLSPNTTIETLSPPPVPTGFTASPANFTSTGGQISLSWNPVGTEAVQGYVLTRNPAGGAFAGATLPDGTLIPQGVITANTSYLDSPVSNLTGYTYTLSAFNVVAHSSPATSSGSVTAFANPGAPTGLNALTGGTTVQLNWTAPASVSGSFPLSGYQVFRNGTAIATVTAPTVTYQNTGLSAATNYTYTVSAFDNAGSPGAPNSAHNGLSSNSSSGFPLGNPPALGVVVPTFSGPNTYLALSWTAPTQDLNAINSYIVWRQTGGLGGYVSIGASASTTFNDSSAAIGSSYQYYVQAVDSFGNVSNNSNIQPGQLGPSAPQGVLAAGGAASITLKWLTIPSGADNAVSYVVFRASSAVTTIFAQAAGGGATQTLVDSSGLIQGVNYFYDVAGIDSTPVTGAYSATVTSALLPQPHWGWPQPTRPTKPTPPSTGPQPP